MRISAIPADRVVIVDGVARRVDLSAVLASTIHAVHWDDERGGGEVEYSDPPHNSPTTLTAMRDNILAAWQAAEPGAGLPVAAPAISQDDIDLAYAQQHVLSKLIQDAAKAPDAPDFVRRAAGIVAGQDAVRVATVLAATDALSKA